MLHRKFFINVDFKGQTIGDGLYIKVQVRENLKTMILKAFISAIALKVVKYMVNDIIEDVNNRERRLRKGSKYDAQA